jgi:glycosyltransferase involved in cell wall biosynthesis
MRLIIVDQSFEGIGGHHAEYTLCVAKEATKNGSVIVLANHKCKVASSDGIEILPMFRLPWTRPQRARPPANYDPTVSFPALSFLADLRQGLSCVNASAEDHVFIHSIGFTEIEDLLTFAMTVERPRLPILHILLRRDLDEISGDPQAYNRFVAYVKAFAGFGFWPQNARFYTDTIELSEHYSAETKVPFETLPIPFDQGAMLAALEARRSKSANEPIIVGYLGDARPEKGYQFFPMVAAKLMRSHLLSGKIHLRLQSNYNLPGGEPGIPETRQALERFGSLAVELLFDPLEQAEYYRQLAEMDIIVLPYVTERYRRRSSGIFVQAAAAGKVIVVPRGTTMWAEAQRYGIDNCVSYEAPEELPAAVAQAIDHYDRLVADGTKQRERWRSVNSPAALIAKIFRGAPPVAGDGADRKMGPLALHVIDGHSAFFRSGTGAVQDAQRRFLQAAGFRVATVFLVRTYPSEEGLPAWIESNYKYWFASESVFSWLVYFIQPPKDLPISLDRELRNAELLSVPETLRGVIASAAINAVWVNRVTTAPWLDLLGLRDRVPVICETHDIQSFQFAIEHRRNVDERELERELSLLDRFDLLVSLSGPESLLIAGKLGDAGIVTATPPLFEQPVLVEDLAGVQDLGELVSSAHSDLPFVDFAQAHSRTELWQFELLRRTAGIDLLFVSSVHPPNILSFDWFLDSIYAPHLAPKGVTLLLAGSLSATDWARERQRRFPNTFFVAGRVDTLRPLYAGAKVVILPITHGAGVNIKTIEAMSLGKPIVATSMALRGLAIAEESMPTFDEPEAFANRIVGLLGDQSLRRQEALRNWHLAAGQSDIRGYFEKLAGAFSKILHRKVEPLIDPQQPRECEFVEWDDEIATLNRFARALIENTSDLVNLTPPIERILVSPAMRQRLWRIFTALVCKRDAPVLKTQDYLMSYLDMQGGSDLEKIRSVYIRALLPASLIKRRVRLLAGCQSLPDVFLTSGVAASEAKREALSGIDVVILAQDLHGQSHRVFIESLMEFYNTCYVKYLAPKGISLVVIGDLGTNVRLPGVFQVSGVKDVGPILAASRVVVAPWSDLAVLHPAVFGTMLQVITACKPLVASRPALWFIDEADQAAYAVATAEECAIRVLDLLSDPDSRLAAASQTLSLADSFLAGVPEWQEWQRSVGTTAQTPALADIRFTEWGTWTACCGQLIGKIIRGTPLTTEELIAFGQEIADPVACRAWKDSVDAVFGRADATILRDPLAPITKSLSQKVPAIRNLSDFIWEFQKSAFQAFENDRKLGRLDGSYAWMLLSEKLRSEAGSAQFTAAKGLIGSAGPDPRSILLGAPDEPTRLDLSGPMPGFGWYPAEKSGTGYHRWTGPEPKFTLEIFLPRRLYRCKISLKPHHPDNLSDFSIKLNNALLAYDFTKNDKDGIIDLSFIIPENINGNHPELSVITFQHANISRPEIYGGEDKRCLGVCVSSISFVPPSPAGKQTGSDRV